MKRVVIPDTRFQRVYKFLWKWISHPFYWCFSSQYRQWFGFKWKPDLVIVKPMVREPVENTVQPRYMKLNELPVMQFNLPNVRALEDAFTIPVEQSPTGWFTPDGEPLTEADLLQQERELTNAIVNDDGTITPLKPHQLN